MRVGVVYLLASTSAAVVGPLRFRRYGTPFGFTRGGWS